MLERTSEFLQKQAEIHETDILHAPTNVHHHSIFHPYGPNKQCFMGEMPIQCTWESDGVGFKVAMILKDAEKTLVFFFAKQNQNYETDILHAPTNVPLPQHFPLNGPNKQ
jgi:hypothetical protein